ncbi:MAG TPA: hypothetical protein VFJ79_03685 [Acidimicrobiales bacterium]|nr:hypothetical protein [Acidimicrobiales bacterium]
MPGGRGIQGKGCERAPLAQRQPAQSHWSSFLSPKANGDLTLHRGNGTGGFTGTASKVTYGWQGFTALVGVT